KLGPLANVLKWIVFGILGLIVLFFLLRAGLRFLANFTSWAKNLLNALQNLWNSLFGQRQSREEEAAAGEEAERRPRPRPFAFFRNPFLDGRAERLSADDLAIYSFAALESWAWEQDLGRQPDETPIEFADRVSAEVPTLEAEATRLAGLYARVAYARGAQAAGSLALLRQFWERLERAAEKPL